jgi:uncharacterized membrane protein YoaK (UPF0700 family)
VANDREAGGASGHASFTRSLIAHPGLGPLRGLLLTLTVVTGVVDAVSILALGRVFVANMTGNVVFSAFAVVGAPGFSLSASLFALAGFLAGAYAGGQLIARTPADRGALLRAGAGAEFGLAAAVLLIAGLSGDPGASHGTLQLGNGASDAFGAGVTDALAALLAAAMGVQNAVARKLAVPDLTTTVLTMTLTGIGADIRAVFRGESAPARAEGRAPAPGLRREGASRRAEARARVFGLRREGARDERLTDEGENTGLKRAEASREAQQERTSDEGGGRGPERPEASGESTARGDLGRRLLAVATMVIGAAAGASLTLRVSPLSALALAAALLALAAAWVTLATRRPAGWRSFPAPRR